MDVTAFSGEKFDIKEWINKTFRQAEAQQNKEQYASSIVMKLQLMIAKLDSSLQEQSDAFMVNLLPRLLREIDALQHETVAVQNQMLAVQRDIDQVSTETGGSMEELIKMDCLKMRIQATVRALKEADNWTTLNTEIEDAIDGEDLSLVAEKLTALQNSLKILSHVQDYENRVLHIDGLKNRLEALSSPQLVSAFNSMDVEKSKVFVKIFANMDRSAELLKYYRKCTRAKLLKIWSDTVEDGDLDVGEESVLNWTFKFFDAVVKNVIEQLLWFQSVFVGSSPVDNMVEILIDVYSSLDPKMEFCIEAGLKQNQDNPLEYLIRLKQLFKNHLDQLVEILSREQTYGSMARWREFGKVLYHPYRMYTARYLQMERVKLQSDAIQIFNSGHPSKDIIDELKNIGTSVPKLIAVLEAASKRCCDLTEGCSYPGLLNTLDDCLTNHYVERYRVLMRRLEKRKTASHSWTILQQAISLNQVSGDLLMSLEQLDITLSIQFLDTVKAFLGGGNLAGPMEALNQHQIFLLDGGSEQRKLNEFYLKVKQGTNFPIVCNLLRCVTRLCEDLQASTFSILFHPIREQLQTVSSPQMIEKIWSSSSAGSGSHEPDMPDFSFTPQEYITQVGQYLMTLPQHLEPYMTQDNPSLSRALLQERVFPFCGGANSSLEDRSPGGNGSMSGGTTPADFILSCVARATCQNFQEHIIAIQKLTPNSTKQLYVDIGYLGDILEDLGNPLTDSLQSIMSLLKLSSRDFQSSSSAHPQKIVSIVKELRSLGKSN